MRFLLKLLTIVLTIMTVGGNVQAAEDPENMLVMELKDGKVMIELLPDLAPGHVERIKELTREGFYDGVVFHRVIDGFMAQTGDPTGTGRGGSDKPDLRAEFSAESFSRGTIGMARTSNPNSGNSQWFICLADARHLDGGYTVWGRVVEGMDLVDKIKKAPAGSQSGQVDDPDKIISLKVQADVKN
jgi:peptidylprolyl isomerase